MGLIWKTLEIQDLFRNKISWNPFELINIFDRYIYIYINKLNKSS